MNILYYLHDGTEQMGPYSLEELKAKNISRETPVWHEGLGGWTHAARLEELRTFFAARPPLPQADTPPSFPPFIAAQKQQAGQSSIEQSDRKRGMNVLLVVALIAILVAAGVYYANQAASGSSASSAQQSYAEKVMTVEEIERSDPSNFLSAAAESQENFWGDKLKIRGVITNKATVATYKDAVIRVTYYSKTKTELGSSEHTIYESFPAGSNKGFEFKTDNYQEVHSVDIALVGAVAE